MREFGMLDDDVDIDQLAHVTAQFSGAEIAGLVRSQDHENFLANFHSASRNVASLAVQRHVESESTDESAVRITMSDFDLALK